MAKETSSGPLRLLAARSVTLGDSAIAISRTLPQRLTPMVGAWCFLDHYGPTATPMDVLPHPHTGLQTLSWMFSGRLHHRDSLGNSTEIRPGELNLMTAGRGIVHSEISEPSGDPISGVQPWIALPDRTRLQSPRFEQIANLPVIRDETKEATVIVGRFEGVLSPAIVHTPLVAAEIRVPHDGKATLELDPEFEHALLAIDAPVMLAAHDQWLDLQLGPLGYIAPGASTATITSNEATRLFLIGGAPFDEEIIMWWNFVERTHDEIVADRDDWQRRDPRFPDIGYHGRKRTPAPELPAARLRPRRRQP